MAAKYSITFKPKKMVLPYSTEEIQERDGKSLTASVINVSQIAEGIRSFELSAERLPRFSSGSHIDVFLPGGLVRQYSICNDPQDQNKYVIAVQKETNGRGGSEYLYDHLQKGNEIYISAPKNNFPLTVDADRFTFVAGGIGVTPIMSMIATCLRNGDDFVLHYCTRSRKRTAFLNQLAPYMASGRVVLYFDEDGNRPDFDELLKERAAREHIYYCGPPGFLGIVDDATRKWPQGFVHFERFTADPEKDSAAINATNESFEVRLSSSQQTLIVAADETIVQALERNGVHVDVSCEEGYCGTCMTRYLEGNPDHRDSVLDELNRKQYIMVCCSRSKSKNGPLILDL